MQMMQSLFPTCLSLTKTAISCDGIKQTLYLIIIDRMIYLLVLMLDVYTGARLASNIVINL